MIVRMCDDYNPNICLSLVADLLPSAAEVTPAEYSDGGDVIAAEANNNGDIPSSEPQREGLSIPLSTEPRRDGLSIPPPRSEYSPKGSRRSEASMRSGTPQVRQETPLGGQGPHW